MLIPVASNRYREPLPHEACHHSGVELPGGTLKREKFPIEEFVRNSKLDLVSLSPAHQRSGLKRESNSTDPTRRSQVSADFFYSEHEKQ